MSRSVKVIRDRLERDVSKSFPDGERLFTVPLGGSLLMIFEPAEEHADKVEFGIIDFSGGDTKFLSGGPTFETEEL